MICAPSVVRVRIARLPAAIGPLTVSSAGGPAAGEHWLFMQPFAQVVLVVTGTPPRVSQDTSTEPSHRVAPHVLVDASARFIVFGGFMFVEPASVRVILPGFSPLEPQLSAAEHELAFATHSRALADCPSHCDSHDGGVWPQIAVTWLQTSPHEGP